MAEVLITDYFLPAIGILYSGNFTAHLEGSVVGYLLFWEDLRMFFDEFTEMLIEDYGIDCK